MLAAAPYPPYPRPLFLLNIFMASSPWLSMKWKPRLKQRKNTALLDFSKICLHFILKIYFDSDLCGKEFCKSNFVFSDIEDTDRGCAHITVLWCQKLEFLSDTKLNKGSCQLQIKINLPSYKYEKHKRKIQILVCDLAQQEGRSRAECHLTGLLH